MELLEFRNVNLLRPAVGMYKLMRRIKLDWLIKAAILPSKYKAEIKALDVA